MCIKKYRITHGSLTPSLLVQFTSAFADLEGATNLWGKFIDTSARRPSEIFPPYKDTGNHPR